MKKYFIVIIFLLLAVACTGEKEVTITKDYVINPNWDKVDNSFQIIRMRLKDSSDSINLQQPTDSELVDKLKEDTVFSYIANVKYNGTEYSQRKVFFNRDNGFLWWGNLHKSSSTKKILGELQQETWYLLAGLSPYRTRYYIYIDSLGNVHQFKVMASNW